MIATPVPNFIRQEASAWKSMEDRLTKMRELSKKYNVTLTSYIHDEMIVEGDPLEVAAFYRELLLQPM